MVGKKVKELRKSKGWSQEELCQKAGLKREYLSRVENGHLTPTIFTLLRLAGVLEVTLSDIVNDITVAPKQAVHGNDTVSYHAVGKVEQEAEKYQTLSVALEREIDEAVDSFCSNLKLRLKTIVRNKRS